MRRSLVSAIDDGCYRRELGNEAIRFGARTPPSLDDTDEKL